MVMIELKEATYDKMLELLEESIEHIGKSKMTMCQLYDILEEVFEGEDKEDYAERNTSVGLRFKGGMHTYDRKRSNVHHDYINRYTY